MKLSYESLRKLDGIGVEFDQELSRMVQDCRERPFKDKVRIVTLKVELKPVVDEEIGAGSVEVEVTVGVLAKRPPLQTQTTTMKFAGDGEQLEFSVVAAPKTATVRPPRSSGSRRASGPDS